MFYDAAQAGHASDTGYDCLSVATAAGISPTGAAFTDTSTGRSSASRPWVGPSTPAPSSTRPPGVPGWSGSPTTGARRSRPASGPRSSTAPAPDSWPGRAPTRDLLQRHRGLPVGGHGGGPLHDRRRRAVRPPVQRGDLHLVGLRRGLRRLRHPDGPCTQTDPSPILSSYGSVAGPGGGSWFQDATGNYWLDYAAWTAGCTSYSCGGARRLFVAPVDLRHPGGGGQCRDQRPGGGCDRHAGTAGVLDLGLRRRHLHLRRRRVLRLDRRHAPEQPDRGHGRRPPTARATGWWPPTAASSPSATPASTARRAPST